MPKKQRLTGAQIRRLKTEKRLISSLFSLSVSKNEAPLAQIACVVSKKVSPKAVVRNTVKRRMRAALRSTTLPPHVSLVLTAKKAAADASYADLREDVAHLVVKLNSGK